MSSHQSLSVLREARLRGYRVGLVFVALSSADLHVERVRNRVQKGGHHIPEHVVRRRYDLAFENLPKAIRFADVVAVFDNSGAEGPRLALQIEAGSVVVCSLTGKNAFDRRLAEAVARGLGVTSAEITAP